MADELKKAALRSTKKLHIQIGVPFAVLSLFVLFVLIFSTIFLGTKLNESGGAGNPLEIAESLALSIEDYIDKKADTLMKLQAVITEDEVTPQMKALLKANLEAQKSMLAVFVYDENGTLIDELHKARTPESALTLLESGANFASGDSLSLTFFSADDNTLLLFGAQPYTKDSQKKLVIGYDATAVLDFLKAEAELAPIRIQITRDGGALMAAEVDTLFAIADHTEFSREDLVRVIANEKQEFGYETKAGKIVVAAWRPLGNEGRQIVVETTVQNLTTAGATVYTVGVLLIIAFAGFILYFVVVLNREVILPLRSIERIIGYYKTGDYSESIEIHSKNELADIADLINRLGHNVENSTSERVSQLKKVVDQQSTDTKLLIEKDMELRETTQKLKELDAAKSMFVSVAAHQMRTPLAAVKWAIKLVMDGDVGPVNAEQKEYLNKGYESTVRMIDLINDLLDVDKIESDKFTYEFKEEDLVSILQGITDDLTPLANEKGVTLTFEHDAHKTAPMKADRVKLTNALQNLIDNAIKYTIGGGDVRVVLGQEADTYKLQVSDTGIGIPLSEQGKVFGKFFRAKNAVRQETDGSGLGLFIVKKIIQKHGGDATFESKEKVGTTFFVDLPTPNSESSK